MHVTVEAESDAEVDAEVEAEAEAEVDALRGRVGGELLVLQESSEDRLSVHSAAASGSGGQAAEARTVTTVATAGSDLGIEGASTVAAFSDQEEAEAERADRPATGSRPPSAMGLLTGPGGHGHGAEPEDTSTSSDDDSSDSSFPHRDPHPPPSMELALASAAAAGGGAGAVSVAPTSSLPPAPHRSNSISPAISSVLNEMVAEVAQQLRQQPNSAASRSAAAFSADADVNMQSSASRSRAGHSRQAGGGAFDAVSAAAAYELDSDEFHSPTASARTQPQSIADSFVISERRSRDTANADGGSISGGGGSFSLAVVRPDVASMSTGGVRVERQLSGSSGGQLGALVWSSDDDVAGVGDGDGDGGGEVSEDDDALSFTEVPGDAEREPDEDDEEDDEELEHAGDLDDEMAESNSETASGEIEEVEDELLTAGSGGSDPEAAAEGDRETTDDDLLERAPRSARRGRRVNWLPAFPTRRGLSRAAAAAHSRARGRQHSFALGGGSGSRANTNGSSSALIEPAAVPLQLSFSVGGASPAASLLPGAYASLDRNGSSALSSMQMQMHMMTSSSALEPPVSLSASASSAARGGEQRADHLPSNSVFASASSSASASGISSTPEMRYYSSEMFPHPPPPPWHSHAHAYPHLHPHQSSGMSPADAHALSLTTVLEAASVPEREMQRERQRLSEPSPFSSRARSPAGRSNDAVVSGRYTFSNVAKAALRSGVHQPPSAATSALASGASAAIAAAGTSSSGGEHLRTVGTQVALARSFRILVKTAADLHFLLDAKSLGKVLSRKRYLSVSGAQLEQLLVRIGVRL